MIIPTLKPRLLGLFWLIASLFLFAENSDAQCGANVVSIAASATSICEGQSVTLSSSISPSISLANPVYTNDQDQTIPATERGGTWNGEVMPGIVRSFIDVSCPATLTSVCMTLTADELYNVEIYLVNPCGDRIVLHDKNVSSGDQNMINTCFDGTDNGFDDDIFFADEPYSDTYAANAGNADWDGFVSGCTQTGTWELRIWDSSPFNDIPGTLYSWSLNMDSPEPIIWTPAAGLNTTVGENVIATPTATTTYTVTYTDCATACDYTQDVTITVNPIPVAPTSTPDEVCSGESTTLNASSSTVGSNFNWFTASTGGTLLQGNSAAFTTPNLSSTTTYYVQSERANCFSTTRTPVSVSVNPNPNISQTKTDVLCNGANNGQINISGASGTPAYQYSLDGSTYVATSSFTGLSPNTYTTYIKDSKGCTDQGSITITEPIALSLTTNTTNVSCNGGSNGSITITAADGTPGYTYSIDGSTYQASNNFTGLSANTYTVYVKDANNCVQSLSGVSITQPAALNLSLSATDPSCNNFTNGSISVTGIDGTPAYNYSIDGITFQTASTFTGLNANTYTITIKDANNCTATDNITLADPADIVVNPSATDLKCSGDNSGEISVSVVGGIPALEYSIDGTTFQASNTFSGLSANNYTVTVKDANNCEGTANVNVSEPTSLSNVSTPRNTLCFGSTDGEIDIIASDGTNPYTYSVNGSTYVSTNNFGALPANTYTTYVKDANDCIATQTVTVDEPNQIVINTSTTPANCNGENNGTITVAANQGVSPYTVSINGGAPQSLGVLTGFAAGNYTLLVSDANSCTETTTLTVTEPTTLTATTTSTDVSCFGGNNGTINSSVAGGNTPYEYSITGGTTWQSSSSFSNLSAGAYTVDIRDSKSCTIQQAVTINDGIQLDFTTNTTPAACTPDGTIIVNPSNGTAPYTYELQGISGVQTSNTFTNVAAGNYNVILTDAELCSVSKQATVGSIAAINLTTSPNNPTCNGASNGSITANVSGGSAPYQYSLDNGTFVSTNIFSNLSAGTYLITVQDALNCTQTTTVTLTEVDAISLSNSNKNVLCFQGTSGEINVLASGGNSGFEYSLDNISYSASGTFTGLTAGNYTVYVKDNMACTSSESYILSEPSQLTSTFTSVNPTCNGTTTGSINISANGGTPAYTYSINGISYGVNPNFNNLADGNYTLYTKDNNNCITTNSVTLTEPSAITVSAVHTPVSCFNGTDGTVVVTASGGTPSYAYSINGGTFTNNNTFSNLNAGTYNITVEDGFACQTATSITVKQPSELQATTTLTEPLCFGDANGSITINANGGVSPYSYSLDGGTPQSANSFSLAKGVYSVTVTDANNCALLLSNIDLSEPDQLLGATTVTNTTCNGSSTGSILASANGGTSPYMYSIDGSTFTSDPNFTGLAAGNYAITIQDNNLCETTTNAVITQPAPLTITLSTSDYNSFNVSCFNGSDGFINTTVNGGTTPYSYDWSNGESTADISNLNVNTYMLRVTDANSCLAVTSVTLDEPQQMNIGLNSTVNVLCNGENTGSIDISVNQGIPGYTYSWNTGETTEDLSNLLAGSYTLTVTDNNSCTQSNTFTISEPAPIQIALTSTDANCFGDASGSITTAVIGGVGPYTYQWNNGETTADINNLASGLYTLTVTDANSCTQTANAFIDEPLVLSSTISKTDALCNGSSDGSVDLTVFGGTSPYTYAWSNAASTEDLSNVPANTYSLTITDSKGCTTTNSIVVNQPTPITTSASIINVSCFGLADGEINYSAAGGTPGYTITATDDIANTYTSFTNLSAGSYYFTVVDANSCTQTETIVVTQPAILSAVSTAQDIQCNGTLSGALNVTPTGGTFPFSITWEDGGAGFDRPGVDFGIYPFKVTDNNNCTYKDTLTVNDVPPLLVDTLFIQDISCDGNPQGEIQTNAIGGVAPYIYNWSDSGSGATRTGLTPNNYTLNLQDANGCITPANFTIRLVNSPDFDIILDDPICDELLTSFTLTSVEFPPSITVLDPTKMSVSGGSGRYRVQGKEYGTFGMVVTQQNEICVTTKTANISFNANPIADFKYTGDTPLKTLDPRAQFINTTVGADTYKWSFGFDTLSSTETNPAIEFPNDGYGLYTVCLEAVNSVSQCSDFRCYNIEVEEVETVFIPSAFTPLNDDGRNEVFKPVTNSIVAGEYVFEVFNRWGKQVFYTTDINEGWDGFYKNSVVPTGAYIWHVKYQAKDNTNAVEDYGSVTVLK